MMGRKVNKTGIQCIYWFY